MDRLTREIYEAKARDWVAARRAVAIADGRLAEFARRVPPGGRVADLGCGPGWYAEALRAAGFHVVALDAAAAMSAQVERHAPGVPRVQADLAALPFAARSLDAAWGVNCYAHVPAADLPMALADLHLALRPGAPVELTLARLDSFAPNASERRRAEADRRSADGTLAGRLFSSVTMARARALLTGAGFDRIRLGHVRGAFWIRVTARRARSLPDFVRPGLRLLICGLNPSVYSAARGVPFARPGNRFWPAARAARLIVKERDPRAALRLGIGLTDLVKRATVGIHEVQHKEYAVGLARIDALVRVYQPAVTCFVGLDGWRQAVDRRAAAGWIANGFGGQPAYLMPSTSGRNAHATVRDLAAHLRAAAKGPRQR